MIAEAKPELTQIVLSKWQNMLDFVANLFGVKVSMITRIQNHSIETILTNKGSDDHVVKVQEIGAGSFCDAVIHMGAPLAVENVFNDKKWQEKNNKRVAYLGVPIRWPDDEIFGTLTIENDQPLEFTNRYHDIMSSFEEIMNTDLALLMESSSFERRSTFQNMSIHHIKSAIIIYDNKHIIRSFNEVAESITNYMSEEVLGESIGSLLTSLNLGEKVQSGKLYEIDCKKGNKKIILVDLTTMNGPSGEVLNVMSFTDQSHYMELQTKQLVETSIDDTTGVYNYSGITDLLNNEAKRAGRYKHALSIVVVRIDGFSMIDSVHGDGKAELILQTMAIILKNETRDVDLIGRLSDDIFVVVLPETTIKAASIVMKRIAKAALNYSDDDTPFTVSLASSPVDHYEDTDWHNMSIEMLKES